MLSACIILTHIKMIALVTLSLLTRCAMAEDITIPHLEIIKELSKQESCSHVEISGTDSETVRKLVSVELEDLTLISYLEKHGTSLPHCRAVIVRSEVGLKALEIEDFTHGSHASVIIFRGRDHSEVDTEGAVRPVYYLEDTEENIFAYLHVFCPQLNMPGKWLLKRRIWNWARARFSPKESSLGVCGSALEGARVRVAWSWSHGK